MAQDFDPDDDDAGAFSDGEVARVTLEPERTIARRRRVTARTRLVHGRSLTPLPKPTGRACGVHGARADLWIGAARETDFTPVLDCVAERGAVAMVQRSL